MSSIRYRSLHPNHVHQLFITISKYNYILKNGCLKVQKKPFDVTFKNINDSTKEHLIYCILADHFSSAIYAEVYTSEYPSIDILKFLHNAWSEKDQKLITGKPINIFIPKIAFDLEPNLQELIEKQNINCLIPNSGFQLGVHQPRYFDKHMSNKIFSKEYFGDTLLKSDLSQCCDELVKKINTSTLGRGNNKMTRQELYLSDH